MIVLPSCPFPNLAWYSLAYSKEGNSSENDIYVDVNENFVKQTLRNRIEISDAQGKRFITLPVHRRNANSRSIADIYFTDSINPKGIIRTIRTAYGASPFFDHFSDSLFEFIETYGKPGESLLRFNLESLKWVECELGIGAVTFKTSSTYIDSSSKANDFRIKGALSSENWVFKRYPQVFEDRNDFLDGLSVLDALFHGGPETENWWNKKAIRLSSQHD
ncbi:MAG: hypothetical protein COA49_05315 [Bacteroidetes bacterium]|nr:MAG: hypothetical protein COA49_05315 [Bacteroidota bacterium]